PGHASRGSRSAQALAEARVAAERADDLHERPEGDAVAVRETAARNGPGFVTNVVGELGRESRLADSRWADDGDEAARPIGDRARESISQRAQLLGPPDDARVEATRVGRCAFDYPEDVPRDNRTAL